jgi:hypothetical protein
MIIKNSALLSIALLFICQSSMSQKAIEDEVVFACLRSSEPMVYVLAGKKSKLNAEKAIKVMEAKKQDVCHLMVDKKWYCEENAKYIVYEGLNGKGNKMREGLACNKENYFLFQKYYSFDYIGGDTCLYVSWFDPEEVEVIYPE